LRVLHGLTGEGDDPVAHGLTAPPANLRRPSERFGNPLLEDQIARYIDGRTETKAHGPRDMPVWGVWFYVESYNERADRAMIAKLIAYLQSIQMGERRVCL
jgi:hypothetical protein